MRSPKTLPLRPWRGEGGPGRWTGRRVVRLSLGLLIVEAAPGSLIGDCGWVRTYDMGARTVRRSMNRSMRPPATLMPPMEGRGGLEGRQVVRLTLNLY